MSRRDSTVVALAAAAMWAAVVSAQQQQPPAFRSGVQVVEIDARVFDGNGHFVTDLTREDFEILEDGVPQQIVAMTLVDILAATSTPPTFPSEPPSTRPSNPPAPAARQTWVFFFDLNHLTPGGGFDRARAAVEEFIATRFTEGDVAGVIAGDRMVNNRLTSVRAELIAAVREVKPRADHRNRMLDLTREWPRFRDEEEALQVARNIRQAVTVATTRACAEDSSQCQFADQVVRQKAQRLAAGIQKATVDTFSAINTLASGLARIPGPKTVVFLSEGFATSGVETTLRSIVGQTARAGARIYAIDVRGLNRGASATIGDRAVAEDPAGAGPQFDGVEDGVNSLAIDTGGMMIRNENNIGRALDRVAIDGGRYYVIGYQPSNTNFDGKYRKIEIRVKRPGHRVRGRQGYLALEPSKMLPQEIRTPSYPVVPAAGVTPAAASVRAPDLSNPAVAAPASTKPVDLEVGAPVPGAGTVLRMRPDAVERIQELSKDAQPGAGDLAAQGWSAYQRGDLDTALRAFEAAAQNTGVRPWVLYALGFTYIGTGRPQQAVAVWERVRRAAPDFVTVYLDLAATQAQMNDLSEALSVLRAAAARWPANADVHNGIGVILIRRNALDAAIDAFTRATEAAPADAVSWLNLGRTYELRFNRARRYDPQRLRWIGPEGDRRHAVRSYERCVALGGPYAAQAAEALARLQWSDQ